MKIPTSTVLQNKGPLKWSQWFSTTNQEIKKGNKKKRRGITPGGGGWFEMCVDVSLQEHLGSESLGAAVDDALERLVVAVVRQNMFLKPWPWTGAAPVHLQSIRNVQWSSELEWNKEKKFSNHTATRCAFCFRLLASWGSDRAKRLKKQNNKNSYSAQLFTAAGRCKNTILARMMTKCLRLRI